MSKIYIALGGNIGNTHGYFIRTLNALITKGIQVKRVSDFIRTKPYGHVKQADFLNAVLEAETTLDPHKLLQTLKTLENEIGREPSERWGPRCIDLDILLYDDLQISTPELCIPHKDMYNRDFVMIPLKQLKG